MLLYIVISPYYENWLAELEKELDKGS
jgi:hypothetical protein